MSPLTLFSKILLILELVFLISTRVNAQIIPDATLGTESSIVSPNQTINGIPSDVILGGAIRERNLFHSFQEFNINNGRATYFTSPTGIENILSRVTGVNPSNILGKLGILGSSANLFLINSNGIIFGPNASLDLKGSFLATTASSINLSDGTVFGTRNPQAAPLLKISVPIGLSFTGNPGSIQVQGLGHNLVQPGSLVAPNTLLDGSVLNGLAVQPGHTLALVGGDINFIGGIATAPSGRVEIGSVASGQISIRPIHSEGFSLDYNEVQNFQNILLAKRSLVNASGFINGNIQFFGKNIEFTDSSVAFIENQGTNSLGAISVNASDSLILTGITESSQVLSDSVHYANGLNSQTFFGESADILVSTQKLVLQNSGGIFLTTFGSGEGGNLNIKASDSVYILGISPFAPSFTVPSLAATATAGSGRAGNIDLNTKQLFLQNGGQVQSVVLGNGIGGNVSINASESVSLTGVVPIILTASIISSTTLSSGTAGNLSINTKRLTLQNEGRIDSSTFTSGRAGSITIKATDSIELNGIPGSVNPPLIISAAELLNPNTQKLLGVKGELTGTSGNITINTGKLSVTNGAQVTVRNDGTADAGTIQVNANSINLDNQSSINATTKFGSVGDIENLGDIFLRSRNLQLRRGSRIITDAIGGRGKGGSITIDTDTLIALEDSDITANATEGSGGNVKINAQGIFGTEFRDQTTSESDITATGSSSELNGVVQINTPYIDFIRATAQPVAEPESPEVASVCQGRAGTATSRLINAGTGGIPVSPADPLNSSAGWDDNSLPAQTPDSYKEAAQSTDTETNKPEQLIEAQGWKWNADGTLSTTLEPEEIVPYSSLSTPSCHQVNRHPQ